jgi:hypothetical protein
VTRLRRLAPAARLLLAAVLAAWLGVALAAPPGFMPARENGALAIVPCPGSDGTIDIVQGAEMTMPAMPGLPTMAAAGHRAHHDHGADAFHHVCQYAATASVLATGAGSGPPLVAPPAAAAPPPAPALPAFRRPATRDRPPAQGPPLPA